MTIAIYETVHLECLLPVCEFLCDSDHTAHIFTAANFEADLREMLQEKFDLFTWTFLPPFAGWKYHYSLLRKFFKTTPFDFVLLNSLESRHLLLFLALPTDKSKHVVLNLHDVNGFFKADNTTNLKAKLRTVSKKLLKRRISAFAVNAAEMKRYIERNAFTKKPVFWLPHVITRAQPPVDNSANLVLTIPGAIDHKRRDYLFALDVFETLHSLHPSTRLILAGRPVGEYGNTILSKCKGLQQEGKSILFFNHEIKETTFQSLLSESTFLFSPLQVSTTIHDDIPEQYGVSKYSGNIYDAIRHGKILLVPATLSVPKEMESSTVFYHAKEHFIMRLLELVSDKEKLFQLQNEAYQNAMNFTKADYAHRFNALLHLTPR